jgi:hypothetical protein
MVQVYDPGSILTAIGFLASAANWKQVSGPPIQVRKVYFQVGVRIL